MPRNRNGIKVRKLSVKQSKLRFWAQIFHLIYFSITSDASQYYMPSLFRQATYVGVGLKLLQLVPSLLCLTRDVDFICGEQTILVGCSGFFSLCSSFHVISFSIDPRVVSLDRWAPNISISWISLLIMNLFFLIFTFSSAFATFSSA